MLCGSAACVNKVTILQVANFYASSPLCGQTFVLSIKFYTWGNLVIEEQLWDNKHFVKVKK
jgi:hypothetical protein